jgi:hypothetical protein
MVDPMAAQLAQLLAGSDLDELQEVVRRWRETAATDALRKHYDELGSRLLELKAALADAPVQPSREELELALTMMLKLAAERGQGNPPPASP